MERYLHSGHTCKNVSCQLKMSRWESFFLRVKNKSLFSFCRIILWFKNSLLFCVYLIPWEIRTAKIDLTLWSSSTLSKTYQIASQPPVTFITSKPSFFIKSTKKWNKIKKMKNLPKKKKNLTWQKRSFIKYGVTSVPDHLSSPLLSEEVCSLRSSAVPNVCAQQITTCRTAVMFNNDLIMRTHTHKRTHWSVGLLTLWLCRLPGSGISDSSVLSCSPEVNYLHFYQPGLTFYLSKRPLHTPTHMHARTHAANN